MTPLMQIVADPRGGYCHVLCSPSGEPRKVRHLVESRRGGGGDLRGSRERDSLILRGLPMLDRTDEGRDIEIEDDAGIAAAMAVVREAGVREVSEAGYSDFARDEGGEAELEGVETNEDPEAKLVDFVHATYDALQEYLTTARAVMSETEDEATAEEIEAVEAAHVALKTLLALWRARRAAAGSAGGLFN